MIACGIFLLALWVITNYLFNFEDISFAMHIYQTTELSGEEYCFKHDMLNNIFPRTKIFVNHGIFLGVENSRTQFLIFYNHNLAFATEESYAQGLDAAGYSVKLEPSLRQMHHSQYDELLLSYLRTERHPLILKQLEHLILPIAASTDVSALEFAVYDPCIVSCSDGDLWPSYIKYEELFTLQKPFNLSVLVKRLQKMDLHHTLALSSRVGEKHLCMVDFSTENGPADNTQLKMVLSPLGLSDKIAVDSGNSYHHYGSKLVDQNGFYATLDQIAQNPNVGSSWPGLQARQGFSLLRASASRRKPYFPEVLKL